MYVTAIHRVSDPAGFTKAEDEAVAGGLPDGFSPRTTTTPNRSNGPPPQTRSSRKSDAGASPSTQSPTKTETVH